MAESRSPVELVLATTNVHKIREFKLMLRPLAGLDLLSLLDFPGYIPPEETGSSFIENAQIKATHASQRLNRWVLADDSGLVVPALGGRPGIFSARFAGKDATDADNRKKLLDEMAHLLDDSRLAYYECALVLASATGFQKQAIGTCEGRLLTQERGGGGFGYDPLFVKLEYNKTFAEIGEPTKNRISHRRKALDKLLPLLQTLIPKQAEESGFWQGSSAPF
jgi:XTP/dITP diphosphohydrolase